MGYELGETTYKVFGACIQVQKQLGLHCMEVDYQRALELQFSKMGLEHIREAEIPICFDGIEITRRRVDFVVWDSEATVLLEIKATKQIRNEDVEQCLLYLKNGNFRTCLLANFGEHPLGKKRLINSPTAAALYGPNP